MKKLPAFLLTCLLLVCLIPTQCFAAVQKENVVYHADGSYTGRGSSRCPLRVPQAALQAQR